MKDRHVKRGVINAAVAAFIFLLTLLITEFAKRNPDFISCYFKPFSRRVIGVLSAVTGIIPFSVAEILVMLLIAGVLTYIVVVIVRLARKLDPPRALPRRIALLLLAASSVYFLMNALWGLNYYARPLADELGIKVGRYSTAELKATTAELAEQLNRLTPDVPRNPDGECDFGGFPKLSEMAREGFTGFAHSSGFTGFGSSGRAKRVFLSEAMSYCGIGGIFIPHTGEANVNVNAPASSLPFTIMHELSHSAGVAPENEANFAAFLACRESFHVEFNYSGNLAAFIYCYNALAREDIEAAYELWYSLDESVVGDIRSRNAYWSRYEGKVREAASSANDAYLKVMSQSDGVKSYGMVVDLLIADYVAAHGSPNIH